MVKKLIIAVVLTAVFCLPLPGAQAKDELTDKNSKVIAYYFHGDFRCVTCRNLEQYAKEAIESNFQKALNEGSLVFKAVNVENKANEHFIEDYKLYSKALVLSLNKSGKEIRFKNLSKIWHLVRNKKKYLKYVKEEVAGFLKEIK